MSVCDKFIIDKSVLYPTDEWYFYIKYPPVECDKFIIDKSVLYPTDEWYFYMKYPPDDLSLMLEFEIRNSIS